MDIILKLVAELIGGFLRRRTNSSRRNQVSAVAEEMGLQFLPHVNMLHELEGSDMAINTGQNKDCINCFGGEANGIEFKIFEFQFVTGYGNRQELHRQTVACINLGDDSLPDFQVKSKDFLSKIFGQPVNTLDVDDPVFAKHFWTCSLEPAKARTLFTQEVKASIYSHDWSVESSKGRLLVYRPGRVVDHSMLKDFLTESLQLMARLEDAQINPAPNLANSLESVVS